METVTLKHHRTLIKPFSDGTKGRFQSISKDTLHVTLEDSHGVFFKETLTGNIEMMNEILAAVDIKIEYE